MSSYQFVYFPRNKRLNVYQQIDLDQHARNMYDFMEGRRADYRLQVLKQKVMEAARQARQQRRARRAAIRRQLHVESKNDIFARCGYWSNSDSDLGTSSEGESRSVSNSPPTRIPLYLRTSRSSSTAASGITTPPTSAGSSKTTSPSKLVANPFYMPTVAAQMKDAQQKRKVALIENPFYNPSLAKNIKPSA
ncbi:unnamed protein product [Caenorhabditis sp. 36 PRJEB53466]|nr:unnamed protein product [Caenorhabditis sp. 36 PRJEB53466]CAI2333657.1 unnamed protein product [Caenorhabditis sp. 36 PRJEB53466]